MVGNVFRAGSGKDEPTNAAARGSSPDGKKGKGKDRAGQKRGWCPNISAWSTSRAVNTMRVVNCCNGAALVGAAIAVFLIPSGTLSPTFDTITLAAYTVCVFDD